MSFVMQVTASRRHTSLCLHAPTPANSLSTSLPFRASTPSHIAKASPTCAMAMATRSFPTRFRAHACVASHATARFATRALTEPYRHPAPKRHSLVAPPCAMGMDTVFPTRHVHATWRTSVAPHPDALTTRRNAASIDVRDMARVLTWPRSNVSAMLVGSVSIAA